MSTPSKLYPSKVDLTNCDKEPIHLLGKIQSYSYLIVFEKRSSKIVRVSKNIFKIFSSSEEQTGLPLLSDLFCYDDQILLERHISIENDQPLELEFNNEAYIAIVHYTDSLTYLELEPQHSNDTTIEINQFQLSNIISGLSSVTSVSEMCEQTAILIKALLGYDRVMLYKFDRNWNGQIISEAREDHLESWLGMHYPATDIPQQARKLFLKQGVRIIADVAAQPVEVYPLFDHKDEPLDLSLCHARAVSPIHIEYLNNMKVSATLNAAIVSNGSLWGLISCHNYSSKFITYYHRLSIKFLTQVFSTQLTLRSSNEVLNHINNTSRVRSILVEQMSEEWDIHKGLTEGENTLVDITEGSGAGIFIDNLLSTAGNTPSENDIRELIQWISENTTESYYCSDNVSRDYTKGKAFAQSASGVLCVFINNDRNDCLLWFKPELRQTISWGGNPNKAVLDNDQRLSPRKSFDKWYQEQIQTSEPWNDYEIAAAISLKKNITEIIINKYAEVKRLNKQLQEAYKDLESFSYSVSHDLRSPLRGIDGFAQILKEDYFDSLDEYGKSAIDTIIKAASKMNDLIDDILKFSGLGKVGPSKEDFSMKDEVNQVLSFLQVEMQYPKTQIIVNPDLPDTYGDKSMIFQLLTNLIGNALKYSFKKDTPIVNIDFTIQDGDVVYSISDNGIGFSEEHMEKIYGVFNRLVKEEYEGSGIGLAIVKRVIDKHNGRIWAKSKVGKGSTFYFSIPKND